MLSLRSGHAALFLASMLSAAGASAGVICDGDCIETPAVRVGYFGADDGTLIVNDGSTLDTTSASVGGGTRTGTVVVDNGVLNTGTNSSAAGYVLVGAYGGTGNVSVLNGGEFVVGLGGSLATIAQVGLGGVGSFTVSGGSRLALSAGGATSTFLTIGINGPAVGFPTATGLADGSMTVTGAGSSLSVTGGGGAFVDIGSSLVNGVVAEGRLEVTDGATVTIEGGSDFGYLGLGRGAAGDGRVLISGAGSAINVTGAPGLVLIGNDAEESIGGASPIGGGTAVVSIEEGGQLNVSSLVPGRAAAAVVGYGLGSGLVTVDTGGELNSADYLFVSLNNLNSGNDAQTGTLIVNGTGSVSATNVYVGNGGSLDGSPAVGINGILAGTGTVNGDVTVRDGGLLSPGNSPGTLTINGDLSIDGGLLEIELGGLGAGEFDVLLVNGAADLSNAILRFSFINDFLPEASDFVEFLVADAIAGWESATVEYVGAAPGFEFDLVSVGGRLGFRALNDAAAVPEPSPLVLLAGGMVALLLGAARRPQRPA